MITVASARGDDQEVHGVEGVGPQRLDLLALDHRAQFGGDRGAGIKGGFRNCNNICHIGA
jgi:hypothetical protein